jgi:hypothetical protein
VNFFYEGDGEISVKVFDNEYCRIHHHGDDCGDDSGDPSDDSNEEDVG